jgi:hypothetical protein
MPIRPASLMAALGLASLLAGCAAPPRHAYRPPPAAKPAPLPQVYFYPTRGQTPEQQDRDRFECHEWAVKESSFDPSLPQVAPRNRIGMIRDPEPAAGTAAGALTGAAVGAVVSNPGHTGTGAAIGAVAGAVLGSMADANRREAIERQNDARADWQNRQDAAQDAKAQGYRRALTACLEGRGYTVR